MINQNDAWSFVNAEDNQNVDHQSQVSHLLSDFVVGIEVVSENTVSRLAMLAGPVSPELAKQQNS